MGDSIVASGADTKEELERAAREAFHLAAVNPAQALERAAVVQSAARRAKEWSAVSIAAHAAGIAAKQLDDLASSSSSLRVAVRLARRAGPLPLVAEARAGLAGTLILQGRPAQALREVSAALADLDGLAAAKVQVQRAAILQLSGRNEEALEMLQPALPVLRRAGTPDWAARALSNRSLLHIASRSFRAAEADLLAAQRLCTDHGLAMWAAYVEQNLGWLASSRGEVVAALEHYERAEQQYRDLGAEVGSLLEARARLLLSVRLVDEARAAAESAVRVHREQQRHLEIVDAQLLFSTVALVQGDNETAMRAADQALRGFRRLDQRSGLTLARYAQLQARFASRPDSVTPAQARLCADDLAAVGWLVPSLEARVLAGRLALARGHRPAARRDLGMAAQARFTGPADARSRAWLAEALLHKADGRRSAAKRAVSSGLRALENYQLTLGATELRAHVSVHRGAIAQVGLRMALEDGNARRVLSFVERGRATALLPRPPHPPHDPELSAALADLRTTMAEIEDRRSSGRSTGGLVQRQVRLERAIADRCRRFPAATGTQRSGLRRMDELVGALGGTALVEYIELDNLLHAVTLVDRVARLHTLGSPAPVVRGLPHLLFALRRMAHPRSREASRSAAATALQRLRQSFDAVLFGPLRGRIGDRPIVLVPSVSLQSIPWSVVPGCAGRSVTVVPSARLWITAAERNQPTGDAGVVVVAGPGLPGARAEADAVAALHPGARRLVDDDATAAGVVSAMDGAALVHIAAHGVLRSDNPFFSALRLSDGPLTVYELERLHRAPHHVVLAACEAATPRVVAVDEVLGLAAVLLAQGTSSLVAPVAKVMDQAIVGLMVTYHGELRSGRPPAEALARAQDKAAAEGESAWAAAAGFVCIGAGHRR